MEEEIQDVPKRRRWWLRIPLWLLGGLLALFVALVAFLPALLPLVPFGELSFDLAPMLTPEQRALVTHTAVTADYGFSRSSVRDLTFRARGRVLDWPYTLRADADYSLVHRTVRGTFALGIDGTAWRIDGRFAGSTAEGWSADASMDTVTFDERDPVLGALLLRATAAAVTNLTFAGKVGFEAHAATTNGLALPTWSAQVALSDVTASATAAEKEVSLARLRLRAGMRGLGPHADIDPLFPRLDRLEVGGVTLTNVFASIRATEKAYLVTEAGADVCGGQARLYALFLNPERLDAGFTLFLDDIDAGEVLNRIAGFRGSATGRLHGKLPLRLRNGNRLAFGDAYLYSVPGESGTIRLEDPTAIVDNLAMGGVSVEARDNLGKALKDLTYSALNIQLRRDEDNTHALGFKLQGSATSGKTTVPVSFAVTFRGDFEQLINLGMNMPSERKKP